MRLPLRLHYSWRTPQLMRSFTITIGSKYRATTSPLHHCFVLLKCRRETSFMNEKPHILGYGTMYVCEELFLLTRRIAVRQYAVQRTGSTNACVHFKLKQSGRERRCVHARVLRPRGNAAWWQIYAVENKSPTTVVSVSLFVECK